MLRPQRSGGVDLLQEQRKVLRLERGDRLLLQLARVGNFIRRDGNGNRED